MPTETPEIFCRLDLWVDPVRRDGPGQMACDEALLAVVETPVMRIFDWAGPWVSAGYFSCMDAAAGVRPDLPLCRRWTGGGVVVHEGDFTFSLAVPRGEPWAWMRAAESYRALHEALAGALRQSGIGASLSGDAGGAGPQCFAAPVRSDIMLGAQKIAGGAQRRTKRGLLHQGSVQAPLAKVSPLTVAGTLAASVSEWSPPHDFEERAGRLAREKYARQDFCRAPASPRGLYNPEAARG